MAADHKKLYIAKDGEILYGEQREEYLRCVSDEEESGDESEIYIKDGIVLHGREAVKEKLADDVRDALKKSGINKWLDKLESEAKEKKNEKVKQSEESNNENVAALVTENLSEIHKKFPSKVQNSTVNKTLEVAKDACRKKCDVEQKAAKIVENVATEIHKKLPSKVKSATDKGLQVAKNAWETGQDVIRTATEVGKVIQTGELPEVDFSGNADFRGDFRGHATPLHKTADRIRVGEAQLQLKGDLHSSARLSGKMISSKKVTLGGEFDADLSANVEMVGLDIQTGDHNEPGTTQQLAIKAASQKGNSKQSAVQDDTRNHKIYKVKGKFTGQADASARGASVRINMHRRDRPHVATTDVPDLEINATAHAEATGVKVDIKTSNKPQSNNDSSEKKKTHPKLRMQGKASASATGVDVKVGSKFTVGEEADATTLEAHAHAEAKGLEVQIGNKIEKPKFKGASASAKVQATGAAVRLGNVAKAECDSSVSATTESKVAGAELNMGNVSLDKGSSTGIAKVNEVKTGLTAFNLQAGMGGKTGIQFSTDVQFGNVALNLGPPSLNISPSAFNLGFGGGIKGSTGTAAKQGKGCTGRGVANPSGGHEGTTHGNYNQGYAKSGSTATSNNESDGNITSFNYSSGGDTNAYTSTGQLSTASKRNSNASSHRMRSSGSQLSESDSSSAGNNNTGNTQNAGYMEYSKTCSHRQDTRGGGRSRSGTDKKGSGSGSANVYELDDGSDGDYDGSNLQNGDLYFDENGYIAYLGDNPHSSPQFTYGTGYYSYTDTTDNALDHMHTISGQYNSTGADYTTNSNSHGDTAGDSSFHLSGHGADITTTFESHGDTAGNSKGNSYSNGTGNNSMENYSTYNDSANTSTAACHQEPNRRPNPVNMSHPTLSMDDQNAIIDEGHAVLTNPHRLPRKLNETNELQNQQSTSLHHGTNSSTGSSSGQLDGATHQDVQGKKKSKMLNDDLTKKVSLVLFRSKASSKKVEKSKTSSRQESKQKLTETFIKVREELEAEDTSKSSTADNNRDGTTEETKEKMSTSSKSTSTPGTSDATDQQDIDDDEEVPKPNEKKKPFGANNNIFTMDSIRTSTYKVQKSNKSLQMIGPKVMGFK